MLVKMLNRKGNAAVVLVVLVILAALAVWAWNGAKDIVYDVEIKVKFSDSTINSGQSTKAMITLENNRERPIEATVQVRPAAGSENFIRVSTIEDTAVKLAGKGSTRTLIFPITGSAQITVEPTVEVLVTFKDGKTKTKKATFRLET